VNCRELTADGLCKTSMRPPERCRVHNPRKRAFAPKPARQSGEDAAESRYLIKHACVHRGAEVAPAGCASCAKKTTPTFVCHQHGGTCTVLSRSTDASVRWCGDCPDFSTEALVSSKPVVTVAPLRNGEHKPWEGSTNRKPWEYRVQLVVAHLDTPELLADWLPLWRLQTEQPFITIVDTGSTPANFAKLMAFESDDVEIHAMRSRGYRHSSEPVAMALDIAAATNQQEFQLHTHTDVFPMRRELIGEMVELCGPETPAIGYQISPRDHCGQWIAANWRGMLGHTLTMLHAPTIRDCGAVWSMRRGYERHGIPDEPSSNNDTEVGFNLDLRAAGIVPVLIGEDVNSARQITEDFDHCRSLTGSLLYDAGYHAKASGWIADAIRDARERAKQWTTPHQQ
jgi:hypothetical protein